MEESSLNCFCFCVQVLLQIYYVEYIMIGRTRQLHTRSYKALGDVAFELHFS